MKRLVLVSVAILGLAGVAAAQEAPERAGNPAVPAAASVPGVDTVKTSSLGVYVDRQEAGVPVSEFDIHSGR